MSLADRVAYLVVQRPKTLVAATLLVIGLSFWILSAHQRFDSEVLNLLPKGSPEVQGLKIFNADFRQGRELIFALKGDANVVADFEDEFVESLRKEPWVQRIFAGSPMESPDEIAALQTLVPQLLLNLPDEYFGEVVTALSPAALTGRVRRLKAEIEAGSPKADMETNVDPLGLVTKAMRPMAGVYGMEKGQSLSSADGTLHLIPVVTNQDSLGQAECRATMAQVEEFKRRVLASGSGPKPEILVTGRTPYVAQIASSMEVDVSVTSSISFVVVTVLFFVGFRRLMPPIGTTIVLALSCFVAFAIGCLLFDNLNMVAISFCSILAGLGDDFSLLLYNRYLLARTQNEDHQRAVATSIREVGKGILYVSFTTAAGFLALLFSGSSGFAQLGTLIAVGIVCCAAMVIVLFFLFIRAKHAHPEREDPLHRMFEALVAWLLHRRLGLSLLGLALALASLIYAVLPSRPLQFDTNPRSLEPKYIPAAIALRLINEQIPAAAEPITLLVDASDAETLHQRWEQLDRHLQSLVERRVLQSYSSPAGLMLSPSRMAKHQAMLREQVNLDESRRAFEAALQETGFKAESFAAALTLFDQLKSTLNTAPSQLDLTSALPQSSAWWFLLDRYFATRPLLAAAYLKPTVSVQTIDEKMALETELRACGVPMKITGWSYTMIGLIPWAKSELTLFSAAVGLLIFISMAVAYRRWEPLLIHTLSLIFALAACVALLKLTNTRINMLNALAFPLILGVGVDYGMHVLLAMLEGKDLTVGLTTVVKPLVISGLTTIAGFGALIFAQNPALKGLGTVCTVGVTCCLVTSIFFAVPMLRLLLRRD
jgi:predicted RND superfamily exporter protein